LRQALSLLEASPHPTVDNLADWLLVSELMIGDATPAAPLVLAEDGGVRVAVARAEGSKCERCWHYGSDIGSHTSHPTLCGRCVAVLEG
jgi:isoleucyl-tRNA synthetase